MNKSLIILLALALPWIALAQVSPPRAPVGMFRWTALDGKSAPQEFPAGSGTTIIAGTMQLDDSTKAGRRFTLSFTYKATPKDTATLASHGGTFRFTRDSLYFVNDGQETLAPVRFHYSWQAANRLALTDTKGHVWVYAK